MIEIKEMGDKYILDRCPLSEPVDPLRLPQDEYPAYGERAKEIRRKFFREVREKYGNCVLFAWDDDKIVGFLLFLPKSVGRRLGLKPMPNPDEEKTEKTLIYACMQLLSEYQGKGLGTMLIEKLIEWANDNGWERIEANHVPEGTNNEHWRWGWALPKWERMGFRIARTHPSISVILDLGTSDPVQSTKYSLD